MNIAVVLLTIYMDFVIELIEHYFFKEKFCYMLI